MDPGSFISRSPLPLVKSSLQTFANGLKDISHHPPGANRKRSHSLDRKRKDSSENLIDILHTEGHHLFHLKTQVEGFNSGRSYYFRTTQTKERDAWVLILQKESRRAKRIHDKVSRFLRMQAKVQRYHASSLVQGLVATMIVLNFIFSAAEAQINPLPGDEALNTFKNVDLAFTVFFATEVCINMLGNGRNFTKSGWNWFDLIIVLISIVEIFVTDINSIKTLRLMRAFRLLRLVKRLKTLKRLIHALTASLFPVFNAMIILTLVISIYSVMGVSAFQTSNPVQFGTFDRALFTMFQTSTLDGWHLVARTMLPEDGSLNVGVVLFYSTFIICTVWTLLPVVTAVLIEAFSQSTKREKEEKEAARFHSMRGPTAHYPLESMLETFFHAEDDEEFQRKAAQLFEMLDADSSGSLTLLEITEGVRKIPKFASIRLSMEDYERMVVERGLCDEELAMSPEHFEELLRIEVKGYLNRQMGVARAICEQYDPTLGLVLSGIKASLAGIDHIANQKTCQCSRSKGAKGLGRSESGAKDLERSGSENSQQSNTDALLLKVLTRLSDLEEQNQKLMELHTSNPVRPQDVSLERRGSGRARDIAIAVAVERQGSAVESDKHSQVAHLPGTKGHVPEVGQIPDLNMRDLDRLVSSDLHTEAFA